MHARILKRALPYANAVCMRSTPSIYCLLCGWILLALLLLTSCSRTTFRAIRSSRLHAHDPYEIVEQGALTIYRNEEWIGDSKWENYYFSLAPDSTLYEVDKRTCERVFACDDCMLLLLGQMRNRHLLRTDAHGSYGLANAYRYCRYISKQK